MEKKRNLWVIPTDKPSRLFFNNNKFSKKFELTKGNSFLNGITNTQNHYIYITSDEEIKDVRPHKGKWQLEKGKILNKLPNYLTDLSECKLVILTTDQDLIADGVQAIDDEFLEWFVKNPSCEEVEVEKTFVTNSGLGYQEYAVLDSSFKVIEINAKIPQTSYYLGKVTILNTYEYVINYKIIIPQEELINCEHCDGDGIYITADSKRVECPICDKGKVLKETLEEVECNTCGYLMSLTEDESIYVCYNSECTSCYEPYVEEEPKQETTLEEVLGSSMCQFSVIENKLAILYRNQVKIYEAITKEQERMYSEEEFYWGMQTLKMELSTITKEEIITFNLENWFKGYIKLKKKQNEIR